MSRRRRSAAPPAGRASRWTPGAARRMALLALLGLASNLLLPFALAIPAVGAADAFASAICRSAPSPAGTSAPAPHSQTDGAPCCPWCPPPAGAALGPRGAEPVHPVFHGERLRVVLSGWTPPTAADDRNFRSRAPPVA